MIAAGLYFLKVIACSALLCGYYFLALRNSAFHQWNRFYLLLSVVLSLLIPLLQFTVFHTPEDSQKITIQLLNAVNAPADPLRISSEEIVPGITPWPLYIYGFICLLFLAGIATTLLKIYRLIHSHPVQQLQNVAFIPTTASGTPFSFLHYIFWNNAIDLNSPAGSQIFTHELVHVKERHSIDKLFLQVVLSFFWCNPFFWIMRYELQMIHEFIADKKAVHQHDATQLAALILQTAYPQKYTYLINPFSQHSIKRRLAMLTQLQNPRINYISRLLLLPLLVFLILAFTIKTKTLTPPVAAPAQNKMVVLNVASLSASQNQKADTLPAGLRTTDIAEINVQADKRIELKLKNGITYITTEAELRNSGIVNDAIGATQPVKTFNNNTNLQMSGTVKVSQTDTTKQPLLVINGDVYPYNALTAVNPNDIARIDVLKDAAAITKWGSKGKNGVISIKLKTGAIAPDKKAPFTTPASRTIEFSSDSVTVSAEGDVTLHKFKNVTENHGVFTKVEVEPQFPGGANAWRKFLEKNLSSETAFKNKAPQGNYTVRLQFIVEKDGSLSDFRAVSKNGYGLEEEALSVITRGPKWIPAKQNGHVVRAYKTQAVTFVVSN